MRIINDTNSTVEFLVSASGAVFSFDNMVASGTIDGNTASEVDLSSTLYSPQVYLRFIPTTDSGYVRRQVASPESLVRIEVTEE